MSSSCDLCCMSSFPSVPSLLSLPGAAAQQSRNVIENNLEKKKKTTKNYPWQVSEVLQKLDTPCLVLNYLHSCSNSSRYICDNNWKCLSCVAFLYIVQISRADIWFPLWSSHVRSWYIKWGECIRVRKMTLHGCTERHITLRSSCWVCVDHALYGPQSNISGWAAASQPGTLFQRSIHWVDDDCCIGLHAKACRVTEGGGSFSCKFFIALKLRESICSN